MIDKKKPVLDKKPSDAGRHHFLYAEIKAKKSLTPVIVTPAGTTACRRPDTSRLLSGDPGHSTSGTAPLTVTFTEGCNFAVEDMLADLLQIVTQYMPL
jgi:hypothetical protein